MGDDLGGRLHRIDAQMGERRMTFETMHMAMEALLAFMGGDGLHEGRLADDAKPRLHRAGLQLIDEPAHPQTPYLFVIGEGEMDGRSKLTRLELGKQGERHREEALHVRGAAAIKFAALLVNQDRK